MMPFVPPPSRTSSACSVPPVSRQRIRHAVPAAGCIAVLLLIAAFASAPASAQPAAPASAAHASLEGSSPQAIAFTGGAWYDGTGFVNTPLYVENGRFTANRPASIDTTISLDGHYVVPPFAEAHTHRIDQRGTLRGANDAYLDDGVFYVANLNNIPTFANPLRDTLARATTVDAALAHGGFTSPGGHPQPLYEGLVDRGIYGDWTKEQLAGQAFHAVTNSDELRAAYETIRADEPDLIKAYLLFAETKNASGLTPALLAELVEMAHADSLRVSVHAQSANDMHLAAEAGADQIAHMPPMPFRHDDGETWYLIPDSTAGLLAEREVSVVTTTVLAHRLDEGEQQDIVRSLQKRNLRTLDNAGVELLVGSDTWGSGQNEAMYLRDLGVFDAATLLQMWTRTGPAIFPDRRIGRLAPGYEASLLALRCNPIDDFACVDDIAVRVKEGVILPGDTDEEKMSAR
jgi:imidazolonepropionase-like amidohydrolase